MIEPQNGGGFNVLLIEDNPGDIRLTQEALHDSEVINKMDVVVDGDEAMRYLLGKEPFSNNLPPDLILLDLNLPKKNGLEVLHEIKTNARIQHIPVVVLTSSEAEHDIFESYAAYANCYISKPVDFEHFSAVIKSIEKFWFNVPKLPTE